MFLTYVRRHGLKAALRMQAALWLNRWLPGRYCWAELVWWALYGAEFPDRRVAERCRAEGLQVGTCYCGMFGPDGIHERKRNA